MRDIIEDLHSWAQGNPIPCCEEIVNNWKLNQDIFVYTDLHNHFITRQEVIKEFGFAIPSRELFDVSRLYAPILEIGAGTGYFTALMRWNKIDIVGTDIGIKHYPFIPGKWDKEQIKLSAKEAIKKYPKHNVFCSWPSLNEIWFRDALKTIHQGNYVIIIEEDACADSETWDYRDEHFSIVKRIPIPRWPFMHDRAAVWRKK